MLLVLIKEFGSKLMELITLMKEFYSELIHSDRIYYNLFWSYDRQTKRKKQKGAETLKTKIEMWTSQTQKIN